MSLPHAARGLTRAVLAIALFMAASANPASAQSPGWRLSADGRAFVQFIRTTTLKDAASFGSSNWLAVAASRANGSSSLDAQVMVTLEPLTIGDCGYARLLAPGIACADHPSEDRDHAHPLIMALNAGFARDLGDARRLSVRAGLAGEPAFGPTSYLHRGSAALDPVAPLTHHMTNPNHIAYGLATAGLDVRGVRGELSVFNGTGNDGRSYDLDLAPLHSYAGRLGVQLATGVRAQVSATSLQPSGISHHPGSSGGRMRAFSAGVETMRGSDAASNRVTLAWSAHRDDAMTTHAALAETGWLRGPHALQLRVEAAQRVEHQESIVIDENGNHIHSDTPHKLWVGEVAGGYAFRLGQWRGYQPAIGARVGAGMIPDYLRVNYDARSGVTFGIYASIKRAPGSAAHMH